MRLLSYLNAAVIKPISRGATAFSPAYCGVPYSGYNGFPPKYPGPAATLMLTQFTLNQLTSGAGYPNSYPGTFALIPNMYENTGATS